MAEPPPIAVSPALPRATRVLLAALGIGALAFAACFYWFDPAKYSVFPQCAFHRFTGWNCPGCGGQRALHHLLRGEILGALRCNALLIALAVFFLAHGARNTWRKSRGNDWRPLFQHRYSGWVMAGIVIAFGVLRNFPAFAWLSP